MIQHTKSDAKALGEVRSSTSSHNIVADKSLGIHVSFASFFVDGPAFNNSRALRGQKVSCSRLIGGMTALRLHLLTVFSWSVATVMIIERWCIPNSNHFSDPESISE